jgi:tetratricopeptide (TPR) repeat protein
MSRSLDDVLDEQLDDALGEDIDQEVASELSQQVRMPAGPRSEGHGNGYDLGYDDGAEFELPADGGEPEELEPEVLADEDLPFDPRAARAFDMGIDRPAPGRPVVEGYEVPPTFDPAAAALFDADEPLEHNLAYGSPSAEDLGAAPADRFDSIGFPRHAPPPPAEVIDDEMAEIHDAPSATIDVGEDEIARLAQSYDGAYTVDAPLESPDAPHEAYGEESPYAGTAEAAYDDPEAGYEEAPATPRAGSSLEDDLDEVDFYVSQNMLVEAAEILHALLARHPGHPLISAKLRDVETAATGYAAESEPVEAVDPDAIEEEQVARASGGTENIDLDELEELEPDDDLGEPVLEEAAPRKKKPAVVLERPVEEGDAETHYDLGLAYKEMGLYDEAIKAFEKLTGNPARAVQCRLMIGLCRRDQGNFSEAVHAFKAGLHAREVTEREKQSLFYEIGVAYEAMGDAREALYYFEMVTKRDPGFLDATERAKRLRGGGGRPGDDSDAGLDALLDVA